MGYAESLRRLFRDRRGEEMVEAGISLPVIILMVMLMLRLFTFYLEILNTGIKSHEEAIEGWMHFNKPYVVVDEKKKKVFMLRGGLLLRNVSKEIRTRSYLFNEDLMVRAVEMNEK